MCRSCKHCKRNISRSEHRLVVAPVFFGVGAVTDTRSSTALTVSWSPATSTNPNANIVYDVFRVESITTVKRTGGYHILLHHLHRPRQIELLRVLVGNSFADSGLTLGQVYYYIVQARDTNNSSS